MSEDVRRGWTTQRMANLLPGWSRARQEQDSVAQTILNPAGEFFDDFVSDTVQGGFNNYISTVSLSDFAFLHHDLCLVWRYGRRSWFTAKPTVPGILALKFVVELPGKRMI